MSQAIANGIMLALAEIVAIIVALLIILKILGRLTAAIEDSVSYFCDETMKAGRKAEREAMKAATTPTKHIGPWCEQGFRWKFRP